MCVAVKVRHPGVREAIKYDFTVLKTLVRALDRVPRCVSPSFAGCA
jgi:predicted unusual protein kinase regulating ubiquinone biosynthesis (AarF/ABC1/UbiB family)